MAAADWEAASGDEEGTASPPRPWERDGPSEGALAGMVRSHEEALRRWLDAHSDDADAAVRLGRAEAEAIVSESWDAGRQKPVSFDDPERIRTD